MTDVLLRDEVDGGIVSELGTAHRRRDDLRAHPRPWRAPA
jgi:hypothetical protein